MSEAEVMDNDAAYGILLVDDEEAILESLELTLSPPYRVFTATTGEKGLEILEREEIALIIVDQVMPGMTGVEFLEFAAERQPRAIRMLLTGYADITSLVRAINDGRIYRYLNKPWEPEELKQTVKRAVDHNHLAAENSRLVAELRSTNFFLEAVMDRLGTGALAVDAEGIVRAANRPAREYLDLSDDPRGTQMPAIRDAEPKHIAVEASYGIEISNANNGM